MARREEGEYSTYLTDEQRRQRAKDQARCEQNAAVERQNGVGVPARRATEQEAAGHAEMNGQVCAALERHQDELPIAPDARDLATPDLRRQGMRIGAPQDAPAAKFGGDDSTAHQRRNRANDGFDFGKLGHRGSG